METQFFYSKKNISLKYKRSRSFSCLGCTYIYISNLTFKILFEPRGIDKNRIFTEIKKV